MNTRLLNVSLLSYFHFGFIFFTFSLFKVLKISHLELILPLSFIAVSVFCIISVKTIRTFIFYLAIFLSSIVISSYFYDMSYDGKAYHQSAVYHLSKNFNPYFDTLLKTDTQYYTLINHYPKVCESVSSCIYAFTNRIQTAKCFNLIFVISNIILGRELIRYYLGFNNYISGIFSLIIALNPVVISQIFTFYVDGFMYSSLVALIYTLLLRIRNKTTLIDITIFLLSVILCNIKFTSLVYFSIVLFSAAGIFLFYNEKKSFIFMIKIGILSTIFGIVLLGYNPYVENLKKGGHMFYPIYGEKKIDIISNVLPYEFSGKNRFQKFALSFLGETDNFAAKPNKPVTEQQFVKPKIPFYVSMEEISFLKNPDIRISGFGPLFSGIVLLVAFGFIVYFLNPKRQSSKKTKVLCLMTLSLLFSSIINPEFWWARFSPQLWLIPIIIMMILYQNREIIIVKYVSIAAISIISLNIVLFLTTNFIFNIKNSLRINKNIDLLKNSQETIYIYQNVFETDFLKLSENGIKYRIITSEALPKAKYKNNLFGETTVFHNNKKIYKLLNDIN